MGGGGLRLIGALSSAPSRVGRRVRSRTRWRWTGTTAAGSYRAAERLGLRTGGLRLRQQLRQPYLPGAARTRRVRPRQQDSPGRLHHAARRARWLHRQRPLATSVPFPASDTTAVDDDCAVTSGTSAASLRSRGGYARCSSRLSPARPRISSRRSSRRPPGTSSTQRTRWAARRTTVSKAPPGPASSTPRPRPRPPTASPGRSGRVTSSRRLRPAERQTPKRSSMGRPGVDRERGAHGG